MDRMINSYQLIHDGAKSANLEVFDLDFMTRIMTEHFQASSSGAVGEDARGRSSNIDRSRDPLYNQLKMYSEVYRMLGWLRPATRRLEFSTTILGDLIAEDFADRLDLIYGLFRQCLLAVTFPNPSTTNIGVTSQRPFRWLLLLMANLEGTITRSEMIVGLLAAINDRDKQAFSETVDLIANLRGGRRSHLDEEVEGYAEYVGVQVNTLENYTRLPVGVLKSPQVGWAKSQRTRGLYDKPIEALVLSTLGRSDAQWLDGAQDVREDQLASFDMDERANFANYGYYAMLLRSGLEFSLLEEDLQRAETGCERLLKSLGIGDPFDLLYSPVQQADEAVLARAAAIE